MKENKTALKAMRKVRRDAIKAKQIERYKGFLKIELDYLKRECLNMKTSIKNDWDCMMAQYKTAINEITKLIRTKHPNFFQFSFLFGITSLLRSSLTKVS